MCSGEFTYFNSNGNRNDIASSLIESGNNQIIQSILNIDSDDNFKHLSERKISLLHLNMVMNMEVKFFQMFVVLNSLKN